MGIDKPVIRWDGSSAELYIGDSLVKNNWYVEINNYYEPAAGGTIENTNGMALVGEAYGCDGMMMIGDGSPEMVTLPQGTSVVRASKCDGPGCEVEAPRLEGCCFTHPVGWSTVERFPEDIWQYLRFCSLTCHANWLAGELAKEEGK